MSDQPMIHISRLKLRNFKSFRNLNVQFPPTTICFAGPNGSGKSNICDSIRFVLGETSLKSLRAKRVKDLIHVDSRTAEAWIEFDGSEKYEIKRAIRDDGKIIYRLNGKKTTRTSILESLKKYNLDSSGRNIIAQGEVQRIAGMSGRERREVIDAVAGISDFEEKKKEALGELNIVESRINEANIVLGERFAYLTDLGRERDTAIKYTEAKGQLDSARATLIKLELDKHRKELDKHEVHKKQLDEKLAAAQETFRKVQEEIASVSEQKMKLSSELQKKQKSSEEIRKIEELKAKVATLQERIVEKKELLSKLSKEKDQLATELKKEAAAVENIGDELAKLEKELHEVEKLAKEEKFEDTKAVAELRTKKEKTEKELQSLRENNAATEAEIRGKTEQLQLLKKQFSELGSSDGASVDSEKKINQMKAEREGIGERLEEMFAETKETNKKISELEKEMLELKERSSIYRVRSNPQLMNPALRYIAEMKEKENGIYGTVADLIQFDPSLARAIEAAAGGRLLYVVVDKSERAVKIIERLKKERAGRATFIPLDVIRSVEPKQLGGYETILKKISYSPEVRRAMEYVFGDTLLIKTHSDAEKVGIGKARMVTVSGEIYEMSGTISGGFSESGILAQNQLKKLEDAFSATKKEKDELTQRLYVNREEESEVRARKSRLDIEIRTLESDAAESITENQQLEKKRSDLQKTIDAMENGIAAASQSSSTRHKDISRLTDELDRTGKTLENEEQEEKKKAESVNKKAKEIIEKLSSLRATVGGKKRELEMMSAALAEKENKHSELNEEHATTEKDIKTSMAEAERSGKHLKTEEDSMRAKGKEIETIFENMKSLEKELELLGTKQELRRRDATELDKELAQLDVRKVSSETRLEDLQAEYQKYHDVKPLEEESKQKLNEIAAAAEQELNVIGTNVNLASIEMYAKKEAEIKEVKDKIDQLAGERGAIMKMIDEIEERKKEAFFEAFNNISENFRKMFSHINIGQGHLQLDKPNEPFTSGMYIRIRKDNHEYSLDALSGGETTLVSLMFIFALQLFKPSPFYILDEVDAALDKENSKRMIKLIRGMTGDSQFMLVSHNDTVISNADVVFGVAKLDNTSKLVGVKLDQEEKIETAKA
ncbi:MAG: chromosome segregation SMC family protein [Candidatus Micrarchaeota archaeon]